GLITIAGVTYSDVSFVGGYVFDQSFAPALFKAVGYYIAILGGVMFALWALRLKGEGFSAKRISRRGREIVGLIISAIVFVCVYNSFGQDANTVMTIMFALQNGFFWQILAMKVGFRQ